MAPVLSYFLVLLAVLIWLAFELRGQVEKFESTQPDNPNNTYKESDFETSRHPFFYALLYFFVVHEV